jgi:uncharacterized protein
VELTLTNIECRVLGCLIEKEITTPEYYPLSLNALTLACNQKSNRDPVMEMSENETIAALDSLKSKHLLWERRSAGSRVLKYEHNCAGQWQFTPAEIAVVAELLLRGPQTPGELRSRGSRMHPFTGLDEVDLALKSLDSREAGPFVAELPRMPGAREIRYMHLFSGAQTAPPHSAPSVQAAIPPAQTRPDIVQRIMALEAAVEELRAALAALKTGLVGQTDA